MAEMNDVVKLAVDCYKGTVEKYSVAQSQDALRQALIDLNGGSTKLNYKDIRDGKCSGLFTIVEEILSQTITGGFENNELFQALVDFKNVAEGDENLFILDETNLFVVDEIAKGTQGIRRQRLLGPQEVSIPTVTKAVRIYEELNRVLAGRVDFNHLIDLVSKSVEQKVLEDVYTLWSKATADDIGGVVYYPTAGTYSEDALLDLIGHVEAAAGGKTATIIGTKKACRNLAPSILGEAVKDDIYNMGFVGKFFGTPVVALPQTHKAGTTEFAMPDDVLTIVAGDQKPIKFVYEGDPLIIMGNPLDNADLTQEYFYADKWGCGIAVAGNAGIGRYEFT